MHDVIRIIKSEDASTGMANTDIPGGRCSSDLGRVDQGDALIDCGEFLHEVFGTVNRAIVGDDDLPWKAARLVGQSLQLLAQPRQTVPDGNDHAQLHTIRSLGHHDSPNQRKIGCRADGSEIRDRTRGRGEQLIGFLAPDSTGSTGEPPPPGRAQPSRSRHGLNDPKLARAV